MLALLALPALLWAQNTRTLTGSVKDAKTNDPMVGVTVISKNNNAVGTITGMDGSFTLRVASDDVLVFTSIGYETVEEPVNGRTSISVVMREASELLDDVVVVGYGVQKKVNLTGSVSQVSMDEVVGDRAVTSIADALAGHVPGLIISGNTGEPGSGDNFQIRGTSSINGGSPLILVDGISMDISALNPQDIESVSVLKDASASAIYGARAAFGVILITTKKSELEKQPTISFSAKLSMTNARDLPTLATPRQTVQALKDINEVFLGGQDYDVWLGLLDQYEANPSQFPGGVAVVDSYFYPLAQTDALRDMLTTGVQQNYDVSVTGGSAKTKYRIAAGYQDQDGVLVTSKDSFSRYNISSFVSSQVTSWLKAELTTLYAHTDKSDPNKAGNNGRDIWAQSVYNASFAPLGTTERDGETYRYYSPRHFLESVVPEKWTYDRLNMLGRLVLTPVKGLTVTGEYAINKTFFTNTSYNKRITDFVDGRDNSMLPANAAYSTYALQKANTDYNAFNLFAAYNNKWGKHELTVMGGMNIEQYYNESLRTSRTEMINDELPSLGQASGTISTSDNYTQNAILGFFYRLNYVFADKYLFETTGRYDGSSKFPKSNRFGFFPSFSAGWRINQENFLKDSEVLSNLKLRLSWGSIGNQNISEYAYLPTMDAGKANWGINDDKPTTMTTPALVRANFTWEEVRTMNVGLDWGFLNERLTGSFDLFRRETLNMLGPGADYPALLGAGAPLQNAANMRSSGWELAINWRDKVGDWRYGIGFNISDATSKITRYNNPTKDLSQPYYEGMKLGEIWGYVSDRLYTVDDFEPGTLTTTGAGPLSGGTLKPGIPSVNGYSPNPGDMLYKYADADGKIWQGANTADDPGSRRIIGNSTPRYSYGINGNVGYKNWNLSFLLQGVGKRDVWMRNSLSTPLPSGNDFALYSGLTDFWTENNQDAFFTRIYPKRGYNSGANSMTQTRYLHNGSYLDLRSVTLSYSFPRQWLTKCHISALSVFVGGENLLSFNHMPKGLHPNSYIRGVVSGVGDGGAVYPAMRKFTFGVNLTF